MQQTSETIELNDHARPISRKEAFINAAQQAVLREGTSALLVGINRENLEKNARLIKERIHPRTLCAVLKGDAYGHGISHVAPVLKDFCTHFAIVDNSEAKAVRKSAGDAIILRLRIGTFFEIEDSITSDLRIRETVGSFSKIHEIDCLARSIGKRVGLHLSLDVANLGRSGFPVHDIKWLEDGIQKVMRREGVQIESIGCHLPDAGMSDDRDATRNALEKFRYILERYLRLAQSEGQPAPEISTFSSASSIAFREFNLGHELGLKSFDRIGNSLFGSLSSRKFRESAVAQVMHAATFVSDRIHRKQGSTVGYERSYRVEKESGEDIALASIGWSSVGREYQGIAKPQFVCNLSGGKHWVVGRQSMNILCIQGHDEEGKSLNSGDLVFLTTDNTVIDTQPNTITIPKLCADMGGVQNEYLTSQLGTSSSALRFSF